MDLYVDLALTVLLRVLKDKKQSLQIRKALLKVFRAILVQFGSDKDFQLVMEEWRPPFEVK